LRLIKELNKSRIIFRKLEHNWLTKVWANLANLGEVECSLELSVECSLELSVECSLELPVECSLELPGR
jgi:hypothetical protein